MKFFNPYPLFLLLVLTATILFSSQELIAQGREAQMTHFLKSYQDAYNAQNLDSLMYHFSPETSKTMRDGKSLRDVKQIAETYRTAFATQAMVKVFTMLQMHENEEGDITLRGTYAAHGLDQERGYISRTGGFECEIRMEDEEWKILRWESFPLVKVISIFRVLDYDSWAEAYQGSAFRQIRDRYGMFGAELGIIQGDSTNTYVISTWRSQAAFDRFAENKEAALIMQNAGVVGESRSMSLLEQSAKP